MSNESLGFHLGIRRRIIIFFLVVVFVVFAPVFLFNKLWLSGSFERIKAHFLKQEYDSLMVFFDSKGSQLQEIAEHYASHQQDALYSFSSEGRPFDEAPLQKLKKDVHLGFAVVLDQNGKAVGGDAALGGFHKSYDLFGRALGSFFEFWRTADGRLCLAASAPITSPQDLRTRIGTIVVGIFVDDIFVNHLGSAMGIGLDVYSISDPAVRDSWKDLIGFRLPFLIQKSMSNHHAKKFYCDVLLKNIALQPVGILRIRDFHDYDLWSQKLALFFFWFTLLILTLTSFLLINFLTRNITAPIVKLSKTIHEITSSGDLSKRLEVSKEDEAGGLIAEFDAMLEELEKMNKKIVASGEETKFLYLDLLEQKKFTSEILSTAPTIILVLSSDGRIKFINEALERITGYKPAEVIGRDWFELFIPPEKRNELRSVFDDMLKGNIEPYRQMENPILVKGGNAECMILWSNSIFQDKEKHVTSILSIGQDISQHKKTEIELLKKMHDLERFYKVTMDRESVVLQLKKKIQELKTRLGEA